VPEGKAVYEGHIRRSRSDGKFEVMNDKGEMEVFESHVATIANGAGQKITTLEAKLKVWLMVLLTPIKRNLTEIRFSYAFPRQEPGSPGEAEYRAYCERIAGETGLLADLPIFNNKVHRTNPIIVDGDGDILRYRQWFSQFYVNEGEPQSMAAE
jgi:3-ketosteroid 9alpha-monooxygenase subunit A